jgi:polyhydroxyalkanoate synthase
MTLPPFMDLRPDQLWAEAAAFNRKLGEGLQNLRGIAEVPAGVTPREEIFAQDKMRLYRYTAPDAPKKKLRTPVLIVYALVNRPYMTDLQENKSLIRGLIAQGLDVYLIDWGYPDRGDRFLTMDDYINGYIDACVDQVRARHGVKSVNILGICQGGAFSLCYASLHAAKVKNLITMVTPVDFHTPDNMLSRWVRHVDVDALVDSMGNIPGDLMNWTFLSLKPFRLMGQKYVDMVDILDNPKRIHDFMHMEKWIFDSPDQAGETYRQFVKQFYQQNGLVNGTVEIGGKRVNLKNIRMPVLNIYAQDDHLVPPAASLALKGLVGTRDYDVVSFKGGHIGIYVSSGAQALVPPSIGAWLKKRDR